MKTRLITNLEEFYISLRSTTSPSLLGHQPALLSIQKCSKNQKRGKKQSLLAKIVVVSSILSQMLQSFGARNAEEVCPDIN